MLRPLIDHEALGQVGAMEDHRFFGVVAVVVVPVHQRGRPAEARTRASMLMAPVTSASQAAGMRLSLAMLMIVQGTTPKFSCIELQH